MDGRNINERVSYLGRNRRFGTPLGLKIVPPADISTVDIKVSVLKR